MASTINAKNTSTGVVITPDSSGQLELQTADTTRMTIDVNGNVGIGTSSPATLLHVSGSNTTAIARIASTSSGATTFDGSGAGLELLATGMNTSVKYTPAIKFGSTDTDFTTTNPKFGAAIIAEATTTYSVDTAGGMSLSFWTSPNSPGTGSGLVERMRIDSSGNVLVGTTAVLSAGKIGAVFAGNTQNGLELKNTLASNSGSFEVFLNSAGAAAGSINHTGATTVSYATSSDYRLKENVAPMVGALNKVAQLKPVTYNWKIDGSNGQGFIAHELQEVIPSAVVGEKDAVDAEGNPKYQGVDTSFLVATLTAAIQELKAIIDTQAERIAVLENK